MKVRNRKQRTVTRPIVLAGGQSWTTEFALAVRREPLLGLIDDEHQSSPSDYGGWRVLSAPQLHTIGRRMATHRLHQCATFLAFLARRARKL